MMVLLIHTQTTHIIMSKTLEQKAIEALGMTSGRKPGGWKKQVELMIDVLKLTEENQILRETSEDTLNIENSNLKSKIEELESELTKTKNDLKEAKKATKPKREYYKGPRCDNCNKKCDGDEYCTYCNWYEPLWDHYKGPCCKGCLEICGRPTTLCNCCVKKRKEEGYNGGY